MKICFIYSSERPNGHSSLQLLTLDLISSTFILLQLIFNNRFMLRSTFNIHIFLREFTNKQLVVVLKQRNSYAKDELINYYTHDK